jgi:hypothetical protein
MARDISRTDFRTIWQAIPRGEVKNDQPHYGLKEHRSLDVENGFVSATTITPASVHDSKYLPYLILASCHTKEAIKKVYGDKGYYGEPNRVFLHLNEIKDGLRLIEASLRLGEDNEERYFDCEDHRD